MATDLKPPRPGRKRFWGRLFFCVFLVGLIAYVTPSGARKLSLRLAQSRESSQRLIDSRYWLDVAARWGEDSSDYWTRRCRIARKFSRDDELASSLRMADQKGVDPEILRTEVLLADTQRGNLNRIEKQLSELLTGSYPADEVCNAFAEGCLIKYRLDDALSVLEVWELDYPNDARPNFLRGRIFEHRTDVPRAQAEYREALRKSARYAAASYNLARTLVTEQKPEEALPLFDACHRDLGCPAPGLVGMAQCHRLLHQLDKAEECLLQVIPIKAEIRREAFRLVGESSLSGIVEPLAEQARVAAERGQHAQATQWFQEALDQDPLNWRIRYQMALSQRQCGQSDEAQSNLKQVEQTKAALATCDQLFDVLRKEPQNVEARVHIGEVFLKNLSVPQGLVWLNSVLDIEPNHSQANRALAEYYEAHRHENPAFQELALKHRQRVSP